MFTTASPRKPVAFFFCQPFFSMWVARMTNAGGVCMFFLHFVELMHRIFLAGHSFMGLSVTQEHLRRINLKCKKNMHTPPAFVIRATHIEKNG